MGNLKLQENQESIRAEYRRMLKLSRGAKTQVDMIMEMLRNQVGPRTKTGIEFTPRKKRRAEMERRNEQQ